MSTELFADNVRFNKIQVYVAVRIHNMVFWVMTPCTVVKHARYTTTFTLKLETVGTFGMLVRMYDTTWPCIILMLTAERTSDLISILN
jgi:hypothetical protein